MSVINRIPSSLITAALARRNAQWNEQQTDAFNTAFHKYAEIAVSIPDTPHVYPDLRTEHLRNWLPLVASSQHISQYHIIELSRRCVEAIVAAHRVWVHRATISDGAMEDLLECFPGTTSHSGLACITQPGPDARDIAELLREGGFFIRLDFCSTKDGHGPATPQSRSDIITHLVSSHRACHGLEGTLKVEGTDKARLYLLPFRTDMDARREYRVFCPPNIGIHRAVAISQYCWYEVWAGTNEGETLLQTLGRVFEGVKEIHAKIVGHAEVLKREGRAWVSENLEREGFTFDVFDIGGEVQLVEVNPFGAMSGCGSCLFHWIRDAEVLCGLREEVEIRVVTQE